MYPRNKLATVAQRAPKTHLECAKHCVEGASSLTKDDAGSQAYYPGAGRENVEGSLFPFAAQQSEKVPARLGVFIELLVTSIAIKTDCAAGNKYLRRAFRTSDCVCQPGG